MSSAITIKMFGPEFVAFGPVFSLFGSDFVLFGSDFVLQAASKVLALVSPIPSIARRRNCLPSASTGRTRTLRRPRPRRPSRPLWWPTDRQVSSTAMLGATDWVGRAVDFEHGDVMGRKTPTRQHSTRRCTDPLNPSGTMSASMSDERSFAANRRSHGSAHDVVLNVALGWVHGHHLPAGSLDEFERQILVVAGEAQEGLIWDLVEEAAMLCRHPTSEGALHLLDHGRIVTSETGLKGSGPLGRLAGSVMNSENNSRPSSFTWRRTNRSMAT